MRLDLGVKDLIIPSERARLFPTLQYRFLAVAAVKQHGYKPLRFKVELCLGTVSSSDILVRWVITLQQRIQVHLAWINAQCSA